MASKYSKKTDEQIKEIMEKTYYNSHGTPFKIIEYITNGNVIIQFQDENKFCKKTTYDSCLKGKPVNPYDKVVLGVGYHGTINGEHCRPKDYKREYEHWKKMITRCHDLKNNPTYKDCTIQEELYCLAYFVQNCKYIDGYEEWIEHPELNWCLDKDIKFPGNKHYSINNCMFVLNSKNTKERLERLGNPSEFTKKKIKSTNLKNGEITYYNSMTEANDKTGICISCISDCCHGKIKKTHGYIFELIYN